jgi:hypothetical protein
VTRVLIEEFPHGPGGHCGSTSMRDLLKFYGHEFTEDMVFGLGAGIDFMYVSNRRIEPPVYIGGRSPELEQNFCSRLGVVMELVTGLDERSGWLAVKEMLDTGMPVLVHADVYYLDYLHARRHFSAHRIVLVGYDDEKGVAFVADNDRDEIQECSLESLARARSSTALPRPADNAYYRFDVPEHLTPFDEAVPLAIEEAVRHNIRLPSEEASFERAGWKVGLGVPGLQAFADDMPAWPGSMSPETLTLLCKSIYVSAEKGGTGYGGNFRRMYGRFLAQASEAVGNVALAPVGGEFVAIGDTWSTLSFIFKDNSGDGAGAVALAHPLALEIFRRESAAFEALDAANRGRPAL